MRKRLLHSKPPVRSTLLTVESATLAALGRAYESLAQGDVDPLVALLDEDVEWYGQSTGREPPS
jgi:hypothetical protein